MDLMRISLKKLRTMLDSKQISAPELAGLYLKRIADIDSGILSYITVCSEFAAEQAKLAQQLIDDGKAGALTGIPVAVKDNICTKGIKTTCASRMLENFIPPYNATVVERLNNAGMVMLGKTSMDEFAMGGSTQTSAFAKTKNPYDLQRVPGGSSGGSAAAVSAALAPGSLGSDTGGSIRQPAAFCGVTGLKPTYSSVSRYGLVAFASSLDQIGPIASSAEDCAILLNEIAGFDPHDGTSAKKPKQDYTSKIGKPVKGLKIALPKEFFGDGIDDDVRQAVLNAAKAYEDMGAKLVEVSLPALEYAISAYYLIASAEASSNLSRYDGIKFGYRTAEAQNYEQLIRKSRTEGFGDEVKRRILLGTYALCSGYYDAYYKKALAVRQELKRQYAEIFENCDVMLTPTAPSTAYGIDENIDNPVKMYLADICTVTVNIAGLPAISTTCGYGSNGMPIGMSIVGKAFDDAAVVQFADAFERSFEVKPPNMQH